MVSEMLTVFFQPAPCMIENHGAAIKDQREDRRSREASLATKDPFKESNDARHVRHEKGKPENRHDMERDEPPEEPRTQNPEAR